MKNLVIQIIHRPDGGGAEFLSRIINEKIPNSKFDAIAIYFNNPKKVKLRDNEFSLGTRSSYNPLNFFKLFFFIFKKTRKYNKVILHGHLTHALYFLAPFSYFSKFLLIYTEHNSFNKRRNLKFLRSIEKYIYSRYSRIISISPFVQKELINWLYGKKNKQKNKFMVIFNGSKLYPFKKRKLSKQKFNFLSIGSLTEQKGFDLAIETINSCRDYVSSYTILGEGSQRGYLTKLISKYDLEKIVYLPGFKKPKLYIEKCDIGLIPSKWEGFGLVSIEMVSSGMPILISDVRGMSDLFCDFQTVKIIKGREIEEWVFELKDFVNNIINIESELKDSSQNVAIFSLANMIDNYRNLYLDYF